MKKYISSLIPRLREFSASLDRKEFFIDVPWVIIDENLDQQKYIFRRDGTLIMSLNGQVTTGRWEYLSAAKCLLIDRVKDKILLNQNFIDPAVMILKKDGTKDENLILANEILLPDLDVELHLRKLYCEKNNILLKKLKNGVLLEIHNYDFGYNNIVSIEGDAVPNGRLVCDDSNEEYDIKDSRIARVIRARVNYSTNRGQIVVEQSYRESKPSLGDSVFQDSNPAPDGKYRLGFMNSILIEGGIVKYLGF